MSTDQIDQGGRAFPWCGDLNTMPTIGLGMTLRDYFAAKALQGLCSRSTSTAVLPRKCAEWAYQMADAMLEVRNGQ